MRRCPPRPGARHRRAARALSPEEAELVELRHARELSAVEIACVLDEPLAQTERRLEAATSRALALLGAHAPDAGASRGGPLLDVFALARVHDRSTTVETHPALAAGTLIGSRYRIVERVGVGAFGDVYRRGRRRPRPPRRACSTWSGWGCSV